jgi:hypothetical protein
MKGPRFILRRNVVWRESHHLELWGLIHSASAVIVKGRLQDLNPI